MSLNNKEEKIKSIFNSKSQNKYDLNNIELSLTNSIDNSNFILLKNGTIKQKRKKNSYYEGYLENKRLNKAMENSNKKRVKSVNNTKNKKNLFLKINNENNENNENTIPLKKILHSDNNLFNKAEKINIFENVIINNSNDEKEKKCNCDKYNNKSQCKYNQILEKKKKKLDKYENLIKTKNMYKDLWKNLKKKNAKKNYKNKNSSNKKETPQKEEINNNIIYKGNNLKIIKNDVIEYNPYFKRKKEKNQTEKISNPNKNLILNLKNLIVFKKQKEYKHYDNIGNNYNFYERNESERKRVKNNGTSEYINILNKIKNETNKSNIRNIYNYNYGNNEDYIINNNEYDNHNVYVSNNMNYDNKRILTNKNYKLTNINMNKVNKNFKNVENITNIIKNNNHISFKDNKFNNTKTYISKSNTKLKETKKIKQNKSNIILNRNKLNNVSFNYFNKKTNNNENSLMNKKIKKNKSYLINIKNSISNKSLSIKGDLIPINKKDNNVIEDYNNIKRKEVKYCKTEKKNNNKISNYNYYNSNQHVQNYNFNYNLRDKEETKNDIYYNNKSVKIKNKEIKPNNIILETRKQNKDKNKVINYHSSKKNHNFYECKTINPNQLKIKSNNNNQLFESKMKEKNNIKINDEIKKNLNVKFNNTYKINDSKKIKTEPIIHHYSSKDNSNIIKNSNKYNNIKVYSSISNKNVSSLFVNKNKEEKNKPNIIEEKIDNLKKKLLTKKRKAHSYSPNKKISRNYCIYGKDKNIILDMDLITININQKLNYSNSEKIIKKIIKEKNDIIKNNNKLTRYLTEKNIMKIPFNNSNKNNNKKTITKNKSFDSVMPPNDFDELYKKSCKYFKLLNKV